MKNEGDEVFRSMLCHDIAVVVVLDKAEEGIITRFSRYSSGSYLDLPGHFGIPHQGQKLVRGKTWI